MCEIVLSTVAKINGMVIYLLYEIHSKNAKLQLYKEKNKMRARQIDQLVASIKVRDAYHYFKQVSSKKIQNESLAKKIIQENLGYLNYDHLHEIFRLVDESYTLKYDK